MKTSKSLLNLSLVLALSLVSFTSDAQQEITKEKQRKEVQSLKKTRVHFVGLGYVGKNNFNLLPL